MIIHLLGGGKRGGNIRGNRGIHSESQNTINKLISTQLILVLCRDTERTPGARVGMRWWKQAGIDLTGASERVAAAADADGDGREG